MSTTTPSAHRLSGAPAYVPRNASEDLVRGVVDEELDAFVADASERGHPLPGFVVSTLRAFVRCGMPEHGFIRVHCDACRRDRVVAFSCKRRGVCSSCAGRRMSETAAKLVDAVVPEVPVRQ